MSTLNLVNQTSALVSGLSKLGQEVQLPLVGTVRVLDDTTFKYSPTGSNRDSLIFKKIDLGLLFEGIEQDISLLDISPSVFNKLGDSQGLTNGENASEPLFNEIIHPDNKRNIFIEIFTKWIRASGVADLSFRETDCSIDGVYLNIKVERSKIYTGSVRVRFKDKEEIDPGVDYGELVIGDLEDYDVEVF